MKKLMIAMTAATSVALVAKAEIGTGANIDFNDLAVDSTISVGSYWTRSADGESTVKAKDDAASDKYLAIDESGVLARTLKDQNDTENSAEAIPANGYITIDTDVQFTATEDDVTVEQGSKMAIWLKKNTDGTTTIVVTAAKENGDKTNYEFPKVAVVENKWYKLHVETRVKEEKAVFTVKIGETVLASEDGQAQEFKSLVSAADETATSLTSVGFKGTGAVDNIAFGEGVDEVPLEIALEINPEDAELTSLTYQIDDGEAVEISTEEMAFSYLLSKVTTSITIRATARGYKNFEETYTKDQLAKLSNVKIQLESDQPELTPAEKFAKAVADAETDTTVTLTENITLAERIDVARDVVIDLGGYTIKTTATCKNGSAFNIQAGKVTIKNGAIDGKGVTDTIDDSTEISKTECDPITVRGGAEVICETLTITIDSQTGACVYPFAGAKATIKSGTYTNVTKLEYPYGKFTLALNQANVDQQLIFVEGGAFSTDPALGDDSGKCKSFLAAGYKSQKKAEGLWEVVEATGPANWDAVTEETPIADVVAPATAEALKGSMVTVTEIKTWAADKNVEIGAAIPKNALIFNVAPTEAPTAQTEVAATDKVLEELAQKVDLAALMQSQGGSAVTVTDLSTEYPMATIKLEPVTTIQTSAKLFKLTIDLK